MHARSPFKLTFFYPCHTKGSRKHRAKNSVFRFSTGFRATSESDKKSTTTRQMRSLLRAHPKTNDSSAKNTLGLVLECFVFCSKPRIHKHIQRSYPRSKQQRKGKSFHIPPWSSTKKRREDREFFVHQMALSWISAKCIEQSHVIAGR